MANQSNQVFEYGKLRVELFPHGDPCNPIPRDMARYVGLWLLACGYTDLQCRAKAYLGIQHGGGAQKRATVRHVTDQHEIKVRLQPGSNDTCREVDIILPRANAELARKMMKALSRNADTLENLERWFRDKQREARVDPLAPVIADLEAEMDEQNKAAADRRSLILMALAPDKEGLADCSKDPCGYANPVQIWKFVQHLLEDSDLAKETVDHDLEVLVKRGDLEISSSRSRHYRIPEDRLSDGMEWAVRIGQQELQVVERLRDRKVLPEPGAGARRLYPTQLSDMLLSADIIRARINDLAECGVLIKEPFGDDGYVYSWGKTLVAVYGRRNLYVDGVRHNILTGEKVSVSPPNLEEMPTEPADESEETADVVVAAASASSVEGLEPVFVVISEHLTEVREALSFIPQARDAMAEAKELQGQLARIDPVRDLERLSQISVALQSAAQRAQELEESAMKAVQHLAPEQVAGLKCEDRLSGIERVLNEVLGQLEGDKAALVNVVKIVARYVTE